MNPREKSYQQWKIVLALFLAFAGLYAAMIAFWNLVGVPMQERSSMDADRGWTAAALTVLCFGGSRFLFRRS